MPFGSKGLIVTWSVPVPQDARITYSDGEIFTAVDRVMGPEVPADFPKKYSAGLSRVELFNANISTDSREFVLWEKRHNVEMKQEPLRIFDSAFKKGQVIASTLVQHPDVAHPERFEDACSVVLQRAVIFSDPADSREVIVLRPYLHSVDDTSREAANFVPSGGMRIALSSRTLWFPLELTSAISEPASYVVLDVLSSKPVNSRQLPGALRVAKTGKMKYQGKTYVVTRITGKLAANQKWEDMNLSLE